MDLLHIFFYLLFTCTLLQALYSILRKRPAVKLPPGPTQFPIIGNLLELGDKPHKSLAKLAMIHGPIMSLKLGQVTTIVVSSAAMAKEVLKKHDQLLSSRTVPDTITAHDHGLYGMAWMPPKATWRNLRKICKLNLFSANKLDDTQHLRNKKVEELVAEVRESSRLGAAAEIGHVAFRTVLNLMSTTVFSADLADPDAAREFKKEVECIMEEGGKPNIADCFHVLRMIDPQNARRRMAVHFGKMLTIFRNLIDQRLGQGQESTDSSSDMLGALLREGLQRTFIEHLLLDLFGAGTDTTANTVEWAMAELLRRPEKLRRLRAELEQSIGRGNPVKESDISGLPYLQAVVKETMRLHPTVPLLLPRKAEDDVEICGFTVPKGAQVLVNAWAIGRDPTTWEDPNCFVPERFLGSEIDVKGRDFGLIPFGSGRRICPGMPLAIRVVPLMVGSLVHGFEWKLEDGTNPDDMNLDDKFGITLAMAQSLKAILIQSS